ncbi:tetratricopeptide (TPR) repeat protein [Mycetocola sp. BIGb0189]|uniref:DUF5107 domain-containing protein n=1 Tax=Mycetocola sp. BIGb0189 TaxID=2940604 RepID=UPI002167A884|nr:DUF5107 domain-containing protein [Mycetocola sp. BIGb0189]MCS4274933.1 tetratricopeptide (TPR) repeat protein [Mycetocola sp. BIGb0189]
MSHTNPRFPLPEIPSDQRSAAVAGWSEPVELPTYLPGTPERLPAFLENRVYQGSSGRVYPLPFIESVSHEATTETWQALHLENRYLRLVILPELGGRVHIAVDKLTGKDLFYRNDAIKPALVGLAGPWISGGIEFNWPQHHRPGTFLPMDWSIEHEEDGSITVWCSDHDPFARMKGMHGIRLRPDSAVIEARVRVFNRTDTTQTFLWWANVAVRVHDEYQSFFPADAHVVADHAKRAATAFPAADEPYYGIDYAARARVGDPEFIAEDADRIDWYRNIPVPTSYMCVASGDDFFGGYDHHTGLGFAHIADHHVSPGKKQWTWGTAPFGRAWDANLSDDSEPYVELMAGVYTDNQPDFTFLTPGETKTFSQFWFPYHGIGPLTQANTEAAIRLSIEGEGAERNAVIGVASTGVRERVRIALVDTEGTELWSTETALKPGHPLLTRVPVAVEGDLRLVLADAAADTSADGAIILEASTEYRDASADGFDTATEPPAPADIDSVDELYVTGVHLVQNRHATRSPEPYFQEVLRRDPLDARSNVALASLRLTTGRLAEAEDYLRTAITRQTRRNLNPIDGEALYLLGVVLVAQGRDADAEEAFGKAAWNFAWRSAAHLQRARIAARASRWSDVREHAEIAARFDADNLQAFALRVLALRALGEDRQAAAVLAEARTLDPLDAWLRDLEENESRSPGDAVTGLAATSDPSIAGGSAALTESSGPSDAGILRDVAGEYAALGLTEDALRVFAAAQTAARVRPVEGAGDPAVLIAYYRAELLESLGRSEEAAAALAEARTLSADRCFAASLADAQLLERRIAATDDARAHTLLAHWLYFHRRYAEGITELEHAERIQPGDPVVLRGLGLAAHNVQGDPARAVEYYARAVAADPADPKLRFEADQLARRVGTPTAERLDALAAAGEAARDRDDLALAYAELLVLEDRIDEAVALLSTRQFSPWEGGEGETIRVWSLAQRAVAARALAAGDTETALAALRSVVTVPGNLGEAPHPLANRSDLYLALGDALAVAGQDAEAAEAWTTAAHSAGDFTTMLEVPHSPMTYYSIRAARRLGEDALAERLTRELGEYVADTRTRVAKIDYFATSLPSMLIFHEDVQQTQDNLLDVMEAQLALLAGDVARAADLLATRAAKDPANPLVRALHADLETVGA